MKLLISLHPNQFSSLTPLSSPLCVPACQALCSPPSPVHRQPSRSLRHTGAQAAGLCGRLPALMTSPAYLHTEISFNMFKRGNQTRLLFKGLQLLVLPTAFTIGANSLAAPVFPSSAQMFLSCHSLTTFPVLYSSSSSVYSAFFSFCSAVTHTHEAYPSLMSACERKVVKGSPLQSLLGLVTRRMLFLFFLRH